MLHASRRCKLIWRGRCGEWMMRFLAGLAAAFVAIACTDAALAQTIGNKLRGILVFHLVTEVDQECGVTRDIVRKAVQTAVRDAGARAHQRCSRHRHLRLFVDGEHQQRMRDDAAASGRLDPAHRHSEEDRFGGTRARRSDGLARRNDVHVALGRARQARARCDHQDGGPLRRRLAPRQPLAYRL